MPCNIYDLFTAPFSETLRKTDALVSNDLLDKIRHRIVLKQCIDLPKMLLRFFPHSKHFPRLMEYIFLLETWIACNQGVTRRGKGGPITRAPSHYGGAKSLRGAPESPNNITSTFFSTLYLLAKDLFRTWGRQTSFLLRAPSNLVPCIQRLENKQFATRATFS